MKAVLMSIQPKWCELIASGKKTVEVRKTRPKLEVPFKVYIYETKSVDRSRLVVYVDGNEPCRYYKGSGKVIGEFVCHLIGKTSWIKSPDHPMWVDGYDDESCLTNRELYEYSKGDIFYEWHITDLVIYDKPMVLGEFKTFCDGLNPSKCDKCRYSYKENTESGSYEECMCDGLKPMEIPPQSWCYVERSESDGT